ncbi:Zn-dependent exopeptidase [Cylindrobasidium torrendii FP15055 ss-10]|uniref:Peptide hydrolase n=1 Tax=Cylindrobasidium torrendii FP15055 ss-10 TaxID=1314674 RepID=A0A0D7BUP4_9AGAR|nr:Zn-dependent exopeptidase [Cylindrobasidium torrendii FP15055 ss-10]
MLSASAVALTTPFETSLFASDSCLSSAYYGTYRDGDNYHAVFLPDVDCLTSWSQNTLVPAAHFAPIQGEAKQLVWLEKKAVDASLRDSEEPVSIVEILKQLEEYGEAPAPLYEENAEIVLVSQPAQAIEVLYASSTAMLLSVDQPKALIIDTLLPRFWKSTIMPIGPVPYVPVPSGANARVSELVAALNFDPEIAEVVNSISIAQIKNDIRFLTGEDTKSGIVSRHSFTSGARVAAEWLKERIEDSGASCELQPFLTGFSPNVICRYEAIVNTTETILISAHYDSRGSFGSTRAPGGDDDGSGTTGILNIARTIGAKGIKFHANVELCLFAGEEQGLLGSKAHARDMRASDANLTLVIQADMTAYHRPGEPAQLGLPATIGSPEVGDLVKGIAGLYSPELTVGYTAACCSDHQSFHEQGFPATQVFERAGPIVDPMYHNSGDLSSREGYDFDQLKAIAKVQFATVLHAAGFEVSKSEMN